ncbi:MAG TPA: acyloxyacyl hydrolase, partial [Candidatus Methylomirabilis sp.]|nr:acyloxyacyl hydrolase [Candidatus Methylomirabilis sp.]
FRVACEAAGGLVKRALRLTTNLVIAWIAGMLGILTWALPSNARAQAQIQEIAEQGQWAFAPGRIELGALIGGGFSIAKQEATEFSLFPRIGYVSARQEHFLPGSFEIVGEPFYLTIFQDQTVHVGGLTGLIKYNFRTGTRWTPYFEGGGGVSFASHRVPHGGTNFNFVTEGGLGLQYAITPRSLIGAEWRFQHFSNADISPPNPSLNMSLFLLGLSVLY